MSFQELQLFATKSAEEPDKIWSYPMYHETLVETPASTTANASCKHGLSTPGKLGARTLQSVS